MQTQRNLANQKPVSSLSLLLEGSVSQSAHAGGIQSRRCDDNVVEFNSTSWNSDDDHGYLPNESFAKPTQQNLSSGSANSFSCEHLLSAVRPFCCEILGASAEYNGSFLLLAADEDGVVLDYLPPISVETDILSIGINDFVVSQAIKKASGSNQLLHVRVFSSSSEQIQLTLYRNEIYITDFEITIMPPTSPDGGIPRTFSADEPDSEASSFDGFALSLVDPSSILEEAIGTFKQKPSPSVDESPQYCLKNSRGGGGGGGVRTQSGLLRNQSNNSLDENDSNRLRLQSMGSFDMPSPGPGAPYHRSSSTSSGSSADQVQPPMTPDDSVIETTRPTEIAGAKSSSSSASYSSKYKATVPSAPSSSSSSSSSTSWLPRTLASSPTTPSSGLLPRTSSMLRNSTGRIQHHIASSVASLKSSAAPVMKRTGSGNKRLSWGSGSGDVLEDEALELTGLSVSSRSSSNRSSLDVSGMMERESLAYLQQPLAAHYTSASPLHSLTCSDVPYLVRDLDTGEVMDMSSYLSDQASTIPAHILFGGQPTNSSQSTSSSAKR